MINLLSMELWTVTRSFILVWRNHQPMVTCPECHISHVYWLMVREIGLMTCCPWNHGLWQKKTFMPVDRLSANYRVYNEVKLGLCTNLLEFTLRLRKTPTCCPWSHALPPKMLHVILTVPQSPIGFLANGNLSRVSHQARLSVNDKKQMNLTNW